MSAVPIPTYQTTILTSQQWLNNVRFNKCIYQQEYLKVNCEKENRNYPKIDSNRNYRDYMGLSQ